jgi:hypothetical protein
MRNLGLLFLNVPRGTFTRRLFLVSFSLNEIKQIA